MPGELFQHDCEERYKSLLLCLIRRSVLLRTDRDYPLRAQNSSKRDMSQTFSEDGGNSRQSPVGYIRHDVDQPESAAGERQEPRDRRTAITRMIPKWYDLLVN